jgi:hypothetical protein
MIKRAKAQKSTARGERLAAALRENLKRRKAQARGRAVGEESPPKNAGLPAETANAGLPAQAPDFRRNRGTD